MIRQLLTSIMPEAIITEYDPVAQGKPGPAYHWGQYDVLILDYQLGKENGLQWLKDYAGLSDFPVTIILTGEGNEAVAVKAIKLGAEDYIVKKDLTPQRLQLAIEQALDTEEADLDVELDSLTAATITSEYQQHEVHAPFSEAEIAAGRAIISNYQLEQCIGTGGMASVYRARQIDDGHVIALKLLDPKLNEDERYLDRFIEEYHTACDIEHNNIVKIY